MADTSAHPKKTVLIERPSFEVNEAIAFIPALSRKYKITKANPSLQAYTLSGAELSNTGAYIDIHCTSVSAASTGITLEVRRKKGEFENSTEVSMANQHIDTVLNLLSDGLALEPSKKSRLLSEQANKKSTFEYSTAKATAQKQLPDVKLPATFPKRLIAAFIAAITVLVVLFFLLRYFLQ